MLEHAFLVCLKTARLGKLPQSGYISIYCLSLLLVSFVEEKCFIYLIGLSYTKLLEFVQYNVNVILILFLKGKPIKMSKASSPMHANKTEVRYFGDSVSNLVAAS